MHGSSSLAASASLSELGHQAAVRAPRCDLRQYRAVTLPNGTRLLLVSDPEATFAAACANVRAGYFDDPPDVPGLAHFLEHAVHLGSTAYPDERAYKAYLAQHGGTSNASTSMVHTSFHFKVHHAHVEGALDRLAQFFVSPLLLREAALSEVENVHAEFSRNCNSDARKLLQLRRSCLGPPLQKFSTGNLATLRDRPLQRGVHVEALLRQYWERRYTGGSLCCCIVAPQPRDTLQAWASASFAGVRPTPSPVASSTPTTQPPTAIPAPTSPSFPNGHEDTAAAAATSATATALDNWHDWPLDYGQLAPPQQLGLLYLVRPQRELRELDIQWFIPYGSMRDVRCKPWRWVGHLLGHEARGSLAHALKQAGLVQSLVTGMGDEVRLGRGFMFWGVTMSLTEEGLKHTDLLLEATYQALGLIKRVTPDERRETFRELQQLSELSFEFQDRQEPLDLAKDAANRLHYFAAEELLSGPAIIQQYDDEAIDRFLSHLVPSSMNVFFSSQTHAPGITPLKEQWYGALYGVRPLGEDLTLRLNSHLNIAPQPPSTADHPSSNGVNAQDTTATSATASSSSTPAAPPTALLPLYLPRPNWALPVDVQLRAPAPRPAGPSNGPAAADRQQHQQLQQHQQQEQQQQHQQQEQHQQHQQQEQHQQHQQQEQHQQHQHQQQEQQRGDDTACQQAAPSPPLPCPEPPTTSSGGAAAAPSVSPLPCPEPATSSGGAATPAAAAPPASAPAAAAAVAAPLLRDRPTGPPVLISSSPGLEVWHQTDVSLALPKAHVYLHLVTPSAYRSPRDWVCARLYTRLLIDLLEPDVYFAQLASSSYGLSCSETGLTLHFQGYSSIVRKLVQVVLQGMATGMLQGDHIHRRFRVHEGQLRQAWQVWRHNNPISHAEYHVEHLLQRPHWHVDRDGLGTLSQVGPDDVRAWGAALVSGSPGGLCAHMLAYGNVDQGEAEGLAQLVRKHLNPSGVAPSEWPQPLVLQPSCHAPPDGRAAPGQLGTVSTSGDVRVQDRKSEQGSGAEAAAGRFLPEQRCSAAGPVLLEQAEGVHASDGVVVVYRPDNPNPANTNSAAFLVCQVGPGSPSHTQQAVLLELLERVASKPCFHSLRTVQRLGYTAGCQVHRMHGILSFAVKVQSPNFRAHGLRLRMQRWLADFRAELRALPVQRLEHFKAALKERYLEPPKSLAEAAAHAWAPIRRCTLDFDTRGVKASLTDGVTFEDLVAFYDAHVWGPAGPGAASGVLCCEIQGALPTGGSSGSAPAGKRGAGAAVFRQETQGEGELPSSAPRPGKRARYVVGTAASGANGDESGAAGVEEPEEGEQPVAVVTDGTLESVRAMWATHAPCFVPPEPGRARL